ncbi:MAG: MaoC family dehydratase [Candidatus Hodarchaeales archaeon]|jgi:3-hydroxybutyryl-CoA dehydratase
MKYEEIQVGQVAKYKRLITGEDISAFAAVSGDENPIHMDEEFAKTTMFKGRIAHGILSVSFISTTLANKLPGPGSIYLKQEVTFLKPVRIGDTITTVVEVLDKKNEKKHIRLKTTCMNQNEDIVVDGEALVLVL